MLNDTLIIRILFNLDRSDLLLIAALLSKDMDKITKSDLLWRLTTTDPYNMSAIVILANRHNVQTMGPEYGLTIPTDEQAAQGEHLWYQFNKDMINAVRDEGDEALLDAAKDDDVSKLNMLIWANVNLEARNEVSAP